MFSESYVDGYPFQVIVICTIWRMEMDRHQSHQAARRILGELKLRDTQSQIAAAQVHALIAVAEQLHEIARAIDKLGGPAGRA